MDGGRPRRVMMVLTRWRTIALALGLATASLAMPLPPALAHAASGPIVSLSGSPNPALSDSDNVLFSAHGTTDNSCALKSYSFDFGDGYKIGRASCRERV